MLGLSSNDVISVLQIRLLRLGLFLTFLLLCTNLVPPRCDSIPTSGTCGISEPSLRLVRPQVASVTPRRHWGTGWPGVEIHCRLHGFTFRGLWIGLTGGRIATSGAIPTSRPLFSIQSVVFWPRATSTVLSTVPKPTLPAFRLGSFRSLILPNLARARVMISVSYMGIPMPLS